MTASAPAVGDTGRGWTPPLVLTSAAHAGALAIAVAGGALTAWLMVQGLWFVPLGLVLAVPGFLMVHRDPLIVPLAWMVAISLLADDAGPLIRVITVLHRMMPLAVVLIIVVSTWIGLRSEQLPRLGLVELAMLAYVVISIASVAYLSEVPRAGMQLHDRAIVPMLLYLTIRLLRPGVDQLRRFVPIVLFVMFSQTVIGAMSWVLPEVLPSSWLSRAGSRTTGSLRSPGVFGVTMVAGSLIALHIGWHERDRLRRRLFLGAAVVGAWMLFMTMSRASWMAGAVAFVGVAAVYRGVLVRLIIVMVPLVLVVSSLGLFDDIFALADRRFLSDASAQSAMSRLPMANASINMFQERPITGFGFGNFDLYDRQFQTAVGGLPVPDKDHSSHNLYLTLLAEQGIFGLVFYVAPALILLARTPRALKRLPRTGRISAQLLVILWLEIAAHLVVNNFANMRVAFGLGMWWITLAIIAVLIESTNTTPA